MTAFEGLLVLLLASVFFLQIARRASLPYPAMLALAGVAIGFIPGSPTIDIGPELVLVIFVAPVLLEAAYDFPLSTARLLWKPLTVLVGGAVIATTTIVALIGWWAAGLPLAAAIVLGAIVAPPDAAAAVAVLGAVSLPRRTVELLKGESLFNDAVALLIFGAALTIQSRGTLDGPTALKLAVAVPGGILLGIALGLVASRINRMITDSLGGNLFQFLNALLVWTIAERAGLSAVLAVVACAATVANTSATTLSPRMRIHSFAVWSSVVFFLNVLAFLMMGLQAHAIVSHLERGALLHAAGVSAAVVLAVVMTRIAFFLGWSRLSTRFSALRGKYPIASLGQATVVGWSGMRGIVTLATAFALPSEFPQRNLVVLVAFAVVLATLVLQGLTLAPLIRLLGVDRLEDPAEEMRKARQRLSTVAAHRMRELPDGEDLSMSELYRLEADPESRDACSRIDGHRRLALEVVRAQREELARMRGADDVDVDTFHALMEELDWRELTHLPPEDRRLEEI